MSIKELVEKEVSKVVKKKAIVKPEQVAGLIKKALGAPEETAIETVVIEGVSCYALAWSETPKPRAPRKAKEAPAAAE